MDGKLIVYLVLLLAVIGGSSGIYYTTDLDEARKDVDLARQEATVTEESVAAIKKTLELRKEVAALLAATAHVEAQNNAMRTELETLRRNREEIARSYLQTMEKFRQETVGVVMEEITLESGQTLKRARIQSLDAQVTTILHSEGVSRVPTSSLPAQLKDRFRFGYNPTAASGSGSSSSSTKGGGGAAGHASSVSDWLVRVGGTGDAAPAAGSKSPQDVEAPAPAPGVEGDPGLWQGVTRKSLNRAYIPGQGWLNVGSKGPIPGSGK